MSEPTTTKIRTSEQLNDFLLDTLEMINQDKIANEKVEAISKIADKVIKNNLTRLMNKKITGTAKHISFFQDSK